MSHEDKFTQDQVIEALDACGGFITYAADLLGCCYQTVARYIKDYPAVAEAVKVTKERHLDLSETELIAAIKAKESWAIKFYLKYVGRSRGYIKATHIELIDNISKQMEDAQKRMDKQEH